ncbi:MAG TPA: AraC family transcriptional regulator [Cyclobacteriaceae bacterium]|nr:AraC family transcriptional regulator [Cyclobacteriaceae bacterium]
MLLHEFPDIQWLKKQIQTGFENQTRRYGIGLLRSGWPTVILNTTARRIRRENIAGPLSLFTNLRGKSTITVNGRQATVSENTFFVSNPRQEYTLVIPDEAETFNIHVGEKIGEAVWLEATHSHHFLLDHPFDISSSPDFRNRIHWRDAHFNALLPQLAGAGSEFREEELLGDLIYLLLDEKIKSARNSQRLSVTKSSTREEIAKRLHLAVDYIYTHFEKNLSLDLLSKVSCLSKFHFVRLFKEYFRESPHQFITRIRLEKSIAYLRSSAYGVREIAEKVGISDSSSFSRLFRNRFGIYPTRFTIA